MSAPIPTHTLAKLQAYLDLGEPIGGFLYAVLSNDLKGAFGRADSTNLAAMQSIVEFVYWAMPASSQGSPEKVDAWMSAGGKVGRRIKEVARLEAMEGST